MRTIGLLLLLLGLSGMLDEARAQKLYRLVDLGTVADHPTLEATAITGAGAVAVNAFKNPVYWTPYLYTGGQLKQMGIWSTPTNAKVIHCTSPSGLLCGESWNVGTHYGTMLFYPDSTVTDLQRLGGFYENAVIRGINNSAQMAGSVYGFFPGAALIGERACYYFNGTVREIAGNDSSAHGINARGEVVGKHVSGGEERAFYYDPRTLTFTDLGHLGNPGNPYCKAAGINDAGVIVGESWNTEPRVAAFRIVNGVMSALPEVTDAVESRATAINNKGEIVGVYRIAGGNQRAFVFRKGAPGNLNELAVKPADWTLLKATAINDAGQIAGNAITSLGVQRVFRLDPDNRKPTVRILGSRSLEVRGAKTRLRGTARDDLSLAGVQFRIGKGRIQKAAGSSRWSARVTVPKRKSQITIHAFDSYGNRSKPLTVRIEGN